MTVGDALRRGAECLEAAGLPNPRREARLLLEHATGLSQEAMLRNPQLAFCGSGFAVLLARRAAREPLALILGRQEFWSLPFTVSPATLVPRADSETLVEAALEAAPATAAPLRVLDLGTGTGCLLLAFLSERPSAWGIGIDLSAEAAGLAAQNARALGLAARTGFVCGDWDAPLQGRFDLVLSNPPYIETAAIAGLMPEVADHEPARALDGGPDGLREHRRILNRLPALLRPGAAAVLEMGQGQADAVATLAVAAGLSPQGVRRDLAGIPRALILRAPG